MPDQTIADLRDRADELGVEIPSHAKKDEAHDIVANAEIAPAIGRPLLGPGAAGADVYDLCRRLAELGYDSSVSRGENAFNVFDASVTSAVTQFRRAHDVDEDVEAHLADQGLVGARTWAELIRQTG